MSLTRVKPSGFWTGSDYVGTMPDGTKRRFVSDEEYKEAFKDILEEEVKEFKKQEEKFNAVKKEVKRWL